MEECFRELTNLSDKHELINVSEAMNWREILNMSTPGINSGLLVDV